MFYGKGDANLSGCSSISCVWLFKLQNFIEISGLGAKNYPVRIALLITDVPNLMQLVNYVMEERRENKIEMHILSQNLC